VAARTLMCLGVVLVHAIGFVQPSKLAAAHPDAPLQRPSPGLFHYPAICLRPPGEAAQTARRFFLKILRRLLIPLLAWNVAMFLADAGLVRPFTWQSLFDLVTGFWQLYFLFVLVQLLILHRLVLGSIPSPRRLRVSLVAAALLSLAYYVAANLTLWTRGTSAGVFETHLDKTFLPWFFYFVLGVWLRHDPAGLSTVAQHARWCPSPPCYQLMFSSCRSQTSARPSQALFCPFCFQTSLSLLVLTWLSAGAAAGPRFAREN
jgi:hypothetical protein